MLEFLGENYYIDIDAVESQVSFESLTPSEDGTSGVTEQQISVTRYEIIKTLLDVILTERDDLDESLGAHGGKNLTAPFKIAFNTLLINRIITKF
jgi:hypothetical protein